MGGSYSREEKGFSIDWGGGDTKRKKDEANAEEACRLVEEKQRKNQRVAFQQAQARMRELRE